MILSGLGDQSLRLLADRYSEIRYEDSIGSGIIFGCLRETSDTNTSTGDEITDSWAKVFDLQ
ncbi:MAG: hypothetical protein MI807_15410, partial [Verrucomicrobiales bacterium]|nr:hypothetical protein [Verrucomicrobiales bacterium]